MILTWEKKGMPGALVGIFNTKTGVTRPITQEDAAKFVEEFEGKQYLTKPFTEVET